MRFSQRIDHVEVAVEVEVAVKVKVAVVIGSRTATS
jgi:hypothetical protein